MPQKQQSLNQALMHLIAMSKTASIILDIDILVKELNIQGHTCVAEDVTYELRRLSTNPKSRWLMYALIRPFVEEFSYFCKFEHDVIKRWPTIPEVCATFKLLFRDVLSDKCLEKSVNTYTIRKIAQENDAWTTHLAKRRGPHQKSAQTLKDSDLAEAFKLYSLNKLASSLRREDDLLLDFAKYVVEVCNIPTKDLQAYAASSIVYEYLNLKDR